MGRLRCQLFGRLLQVGRVELREITRHALLQLCAAPFHFPAREVLVAGVDGFELTPIDRNARCREQAHLAAQFDKLHADLLDRRPTILAEVGNGLVIGNEPAGQPYHLNIAPSFTLKPAARLNAIEVAVNVELQQSRWMIRRPPGCLRSNPIETQSAEVKFVNEGIDHPNWIVLVDPVFQALWKQRRLPAIDTLNEAPHSIPPPIASESYSANQITKCVFTQPGSFADILGYPHTQAFG